MAMVRTDCCCCRFMEGLFPWSIQGKCARVAGRARALAWHIGGIGALSMAGGVGFLVVRSPAGKGSSPPMLRPDAKAAYHLAALPPKART